MAWIQIDHQRSIWGRIAAPERDCWIRLPPQPLKTWSIATTSSPSSNGHSTSARRRLGWVTWDDLEKADQHLRNTKVVDVIVRFTLTGIEFRGNELGVFNPSYAGTVTRRRWNGLRAVLLDQYYFLEKFAVCCSILYCYLFKLEYIFNLKPLWLFLLIMGLLRFYSVDFRRSNIIYLYIP